MPNKPAALSAYKPTLRNKGSQALISALEAMGAQTGQGSTARRLVEGLNGPEVGRPQGMTVADLVPILGSVYQGQEGLQDLNTPGQRIKGGLNMAMGAVPLIPGPAKSAARDVVGGMSKAAERVAAKNGVRSSAMARALETPNLDMEDYAQQALDDGMWETYAKATYKDPAVRGEVKIDPKRPAAFYAPADMPRTPDALAKAMSEAPAAPKAPAKARRGLLATADLRDMTPEQASAAVRGDPHLMPAPDGSYIGGPANLKGPEGLAAMRAKFDADVAAGAKGADWYDRARASNPVIAGPDPARQRLLAQEEALWSSQSAPDANLNFALQGHNAYEAGAPLAKVHTGQQASAYNRARDAGTDIPLGPKTGVYGQHLDPTKPPATTGTNDIWHARAMGYTQEGQDLFQRAPSAQEHRFMDYETIAAMNRANESAAGGKTDWTGAQVQAAPWVAGKGASMSGGIDAAAKTYPDYFDKYTAYGTHEAQPGAMTGHLPESVNWSPEQRAAYAADPRSQWADENGRDVMYDAAGMYQQPQLPATGVYTPPGGQLETNAAQVSRPMVGTEGSERLDQAGKAMMGGVEGARAYIDAQGAGAGHGLINTGPVGSQGSVNVPGQGPTDPQVILRLRDIGAKYGLPDIVDRGNGVTMTNFSDATPSGSETGKAIKGPLGQELQQAMPGAQPQRTGVESVYRGLEDKWTGGAAPGQPPIQGTGMATQQMLEWVQSPEATGLFAKLDASPQIREAALMRMQRDEEMAAQGGGPVRPDIQRARQILGTHGFSGLLAALKRGDALPAVALPILGVAYAMSQSQSGNVAPSSASMNGL